MAHLSSPVSDLKDRYDVVVVGTGYGGAIAASRLARAGRSVCVLERGREFQPGEYPQHLAEAAQELQVDAPEGHVGRRTGLYDIRVNEDINVFMGCGLGGTSLVNANVALRAEPRVFDDARWPAALRADLAGGIEAGYRRAEEMLKPNPTPDQRPPLRKMEAQRTAAGTLGEPFKKTPINVNFDVDGPNHVGVEQKPCTMCGDCMTGCNHAAKNTLIMNYLPDARNHGAEIFCQVGVRHVERQGDAWVVHYQLLDTGREKFDAPTLTVRAATVILAAGALGSTEVLLRSRARGLALSTQLGRRFTGNGDVLAFGYNTAERINGMGYGHRAPGEVPPVGPCITSVIDAREKPVLEDGMVIEEGSIAGPLTAIAPGVFAATAALVGRDDRGLGEKVAAKAREAESLLLGAYHGATQHLQTYLIMAHDDGEGRMELADDRLRVRWPGVGRQRVFEAANANLKKASEALGGVFVKNPTWTKLLKHEVVTVHPLGGCVMGEDAGGGVVDHKGRVFAGAAGAAVHEGLYVCDGAVIPRSLGVNPLLTISAVSERTVALLAADRGWTIDYTLPSAPGAAPAERRLGIQFTETMRGFWSTKVSDDYARGADQGRQDGSPFAFTLTIASDDLETMLKDPRHAARIIGTVDAPALSPAPLTATQGTFNLFSDDPDEVNARRMWYRMRLTADDGRVFAFEGFKRVHHDRGQVDMWPDTSTLYITVWQGEGAAGTPMGRGILHIEPADFAKQMTTLEVRNARSLAQRLSALARFGAFFAGSVWDVYGGVLAPTTPFRKDAPPRARRPLRAPAPTLHGVTTSDGVTLRLTRFQGGGKGPVLLAPGFGTSGKAFTIDTVETNLPEFLVAHGYDVFVFEYRASPELPSALTQFSVDEIATRDWPAAVAEVRRLTGAASVQALGHCVGSMSLLCGLLAGLEGVRSAVCSALTTHPDAPFLTNVKAKMHLGNLLFDAGVHTMTTDADVSRWQERLFDEAMKLYPSHEGCRSPVCRRILFLYGEVYKHDKLNEATHDAIHEMFGVANLTTLKHVTAMVRTGHVVDSAGADVYLPHAERLRLPIALLHGEENRMFLPSGSEKCLAWMTQANGPSYYVRHVIPTYGHMDCFMGKDAARDVFPVILKELEAHA